MSCLEERGRPARGGPRSGKGVIVEDPQRILKSYFGYDAFRPNQRRIVDAILAGRDVLAVMPTGAGKSICYQVPALCLDGLTLVVSPLISLMKDQVSALGQAGIRAAFVNSSLTPAQRRNVVDAAGKGAYSLLYVAPERLEEPDFLAQCREGAKRTIQEKFEIHKMADATYQVYEKAVNG